MMLYHGSSIHGIKTFSNFTKNGKISTIFGTEGTERHGIFLTPDKNVAKDYAGDTGHVYTVKATLNKPFDMRNGVSEKMEQDFVDAGGSTRFLYNHQEPWEKFDGESGGHFISILKKAGYDSAIIHEISPHDGTKHESHIAFDSNQVRINEEKMNLQDFLVEAKVGNYASIDASIPDSIKHKIESYKFSVDPIPDDELHATLIYSIGTLVDNEKVQKTVRFYQKERIQWYNHWC